MTRTAREVFDLAVVGGGLTGGVLFLALADLADRFGLSMVLCERNPVLADGDNRLIALSYGGAHILTRFGLWRDIASEAFPIDGLELFLDGRTILIWAEDLSLPVLGYTVPYSVLRRAIYTGLERSCMQGKSLSMKRPFSVTRIELGSSRSTLKDGTTDIRSRLILCAQGSKMHLPVPISYHEDPLHRPVWVMAAYCDMGRPGRGYWFGADGAFLALVPHKKSYTAVFSPSPSDGMNACEQSISRLTNNRVVPVRESMKSFPIASYQAMERVKGSLVLFGNIAHNMPSLGGQNYNLTLFTIREFQKSLARHLEQGRGIDDGSFLRRFIKGTERETTQRVAAVRYLNSVVQGRGIRTTLHRSGLGLLGHLPYIKNLLFRRLLGASWLDL